MPMPWKRSKKLSQPCGADPREACAWHTDRGVVPGRDAGRPEEQAHLSLGQEGLPSPRHARSTDRIDLLVRCGLPRTRDWPRPRAAGLQQRSHAAPSRRDRNQGHLGCPRDRPARSSRLAWHENAEGPKQHVVDATAAARTRTQRPRKHLAVHATELAFQPGFQILRRHRRPLLLRLEHAYRSALENHVRRTPRLGNRRSFNVRIGISRVRRKPERIIEIICSSSSSANSLTMFSNTNSLGMTEPTNFTNSCGRSRHMLSSAALPLVNVLPSFAG